MSDRLANLLAAAAQLVTDRVEQEAAGELGLGTSAAAALVSLEHHPDQTIEALRRPLTLSHSGTVRLIDRLVDRGLVQRGRTGGRDVHLSLTQAGRTATKGLHAARLNAATEAMSPLAPVDRRHLESILCALLAAHTHDEEDLCRICRLCDLDACQSRTPCPVDLALA